MLRRAAGADHEPRRCGEAERARARDRQHVAAGEQRALEIARRNAPVPGEKRQRRRADVRAAFTVAVTGLRQLAAAYPGHVAEDTGRVPAQETETHGSAAAGRCPGAVPGSGQQRKKET